MADHQRLWVRTDRLIAEWNAHQGEGWLPLGISRLDCGCVVDDFSDGRMWRPCMGHEGEGHLSVLSGPMDGVYVARCLVLVCPWKDERFWESDAISAAQQHWMDTRAQPGQPGSGSS